MRRIFWHLCCICIVPRVPEIWPLETVQGLVVHPVYCYEDPTTVPVSLPPPFLRS
jgi:hypothetical protein